MPARSEITVHTSPGANRYAAPNERIIEFSSPNGGGLIAFQMHDDGTLTVEPYRLDPSVDVNLPPDAYTFYMLRPSDVGRTRLRAFGGVWPLSDSIGHVRAGDVGKRVYAVPTGVEGDFVLQFENNEQRDAREGTTT